MAIESLGALVVLLPLLSLGAGQGGSVQVFHPDFYVAVAAVIPVVWLTAGFASQSIISSLEFLRRVEDVIDRLAILVAVPFIFLQVLIVKFLSKQDRASSTLIVNYVGMLINQGALRLRIIATWIFVLAGLGGEVSSILALAWQDPSREIKNWTLAFVMVIIGFGALILAVGLLAAIRTQGHSSKERMAEKDQKRHVLTEAMLSGQEEQILSLLGELIRGGSLKDNGGGDSIEHGSVPDGETDTLQRNLKDIPPVGAPADALEVTQESPSRGPTTQEPREDREPDG
jgi:hypothetical protein